MKLSSSFEFNGEHFSLNMVSSPLTTPFVYHVHIPAHQVQKTAHHTAPIPIEATIHENRNVELANVHAKYFDSIDGLKLAIKLSLIGE